MAPLEYPPFPIRLSSRRLEHAVVLKYEMDVIHRDTGEPLTSTGELLLMSVLIKDKDSLVSQVFEFISRSCFKHEAKEAFHYNGERVYDPHV